MASKFLGMKERNPVIKRIGIHSIEVAVLATFDDVVRTYNIVTGMMSDECKPFEVAINHTMMWLDNKGYLGEIECRVPSLVEYAPCSASITSELREYFPQFAILSSNNISLAQRCESGFILWLASDKVIDTKIHYKTLQFLIANDELVGIVAHQASQEQPFP